MRGHAVCDLRFQAASYATANAHQGLFSVVHNPPSMITQCYRLYIERRDASRNVARFYAMSIDPASSVVGEELEAGVERYNTPSTKSWKPSSCFWSYPSIALASRRHVG